MDLNYDEVFELGAEETEAAEPSTENTVQPDTEQEVEGAEEREAAEPAVESKKTEEDARFAAARRRAEADRDEAIAKVRREAQEQAQKAVDEAIRGSGMTNPYTGQPINTLAELEAYQQRYSADQAASVQKKAGMTPEQYQAFVNSLPEVRQARQAQQQAEAASRQVRERAARERIQTELQEITRLNPSIREVGDLAKMDTYPRLRELVHRGNTLADAYRLANFDALTQRAAEATRKTALTAAKSKEHLAPTAQRGTGSASVPDDIKAEYKALMPDITDDEIQKHYEKYVRK